MIMIIGTPMPTSTPTMIGVLLSGVLSVGEVITVVLALVARDVVTVVVGGEPKQHSLSTTTRMLMSC